MRGSDISVRAAVCDDVPRLCQMLEAFNRLEQIEWDETVVAPALRRLIDDPSLGFVGMVEVAARVVGYFVVTWGYDLEWGGRDSFLTDIYLEPDARGAGIGARVLASYRDVALLNPEGLPAVRAGHDKRGQVLLILCHSRIVELDPHGIESGQVREGMIELDS